MKNDINIKQKVTNRKRNTELKTTRHAKIRKQQRGFSKFVMNIILNYGRYKEAPGGATKVYFGNKEYQKIVAELKRALQMMDKAKGGNIVIANNKILTLYKN